MYSIIVGKGGISPSYFLDRMSWFEVDSCLRGIEYKERISWEQTRMLGYITAQSHSTKALKYSDIIRFDWDEEQKSASTIDFDLVDKLKERVKMRETELNNK